MPELRQANLIAGQGKTTVVGGRDIARVACAVTCPGRHQQFVAIQYGKNRRRSSPGSIVMLSLHGHAEVSTACC